MKGSLQHKSRKNPELVPTIVVVLKRPITDSDRNVNLIQIENDISDFFTCLGVWKLNTFVVK